MCESYFAALLFVVLFSYFHNFDILFFVLLYVLNKFVLLQKLKDVVDFHYQDAVSLFVIYFFLGVYLFVFTDSNSFLSVIYLIYNYAFDLIVIRLLKCELKSY
ncbi:hypothetical protein [Nautilia sp.]